MLEKINFEFLGWYVHKLNFDVTFISVYILEENDCGTTKNVDFGLERRPPENIGYAHSLKTVFRH